MLVQSAQIAAPAHVVVAEEGRQPGHVACGHPQVGGEGAGVVHGAQDHGRAGVAGVAGGLGKDFFVSVQLCLRKVRQTAPAIKDRALLGVTVEAKSYVYSVHRVSSAIEA